jgi:polyvinyl alcohol dehydrogenase (cytochrome)
VDHRHVAGCRELFGRVCLVGVLALATSCGSEAVASPSPTSASGSSTAAAEWSDPTNGLAGLGVAGSTVHAIGGATLRERWRVHGTGPLFGPPVVADGVVYVVSSTGAKAVDAASGRVRWSNPHVTSFAGFTRRGRWLYAVAADATRVTKVDSTDGRIKWTQVLPAQANAATFAPPRVVDGMVLVGESSTESLTEADSLTFRGRMYGLDDVTGAIRWQTFTTDPPHSGASVWTFSTVDPATHTVYFGTSNNYADPASATSDTVFALDLRTGAKRWSRQLLAGDVWAFRNQGAQGEFDYDVSTSPMLLDGVHGAPPLVVVAQKNGKVSALDRHDGRLVWQHQVSNGGRQGGVLGNLAFDGRHILVVGNNGSDPGPAAEPPNGEEVVPRLFWPTGAVPTSVLEALDPVSGQVVWERQLAAWSLAAVTVVDGRGFVPVGKGVEMFDPTTGELLDREPLPVETSSAVVGGGRMVYVGVSGGWNSNGDDLIAYEIHDG